MFYATGKQGYVEIIKNSWKFASYVSFCIGWLSGNDARSSIGVVWIRATKFGRFVSDCQRSPL